MFHIVTPFPILLNFAFYAPLILRIVLGFYSINLGINQKRDPKNIYFQAILIIVGLMVVAGFYTQIATIILAIIFAIALIKASLLPMENIGRKELMLLIAISLSLLLLGAGAYAIDFPL